MDSKPTKKPSGASSKPTGAVVDTQRIHVTTTGKHPISNALRTVVARISSPLLPDDYLRLVNPLWSARELRGRVIEVRREAVDTATLVIKPGWGFSLNYQPGQYVGIGLLVDGRWRWRSYSLTSSPVSGERTIAITVKALAEGFLSTHLVGGVEPGTIVRLAAPRGNFVMPDPPPASVLFLTGGSGLTPVMSMLRTLARRDQINDVVHLHSSPTDADVLFGEELQELTRRHDGYHLQRRRTRTQGRLDLGHLDDVVSDWRERHTWACGPEQMLDDAERVWTAAGIADRLHLERFAVSRAAPHGQGGTVAFKKSGRSVVTDAATTLMDAGENLGIQMPFGCRMGICQSCVVPLLEGHVRDLRTGVEYEPGNRIQTCVCAASGDCVLDV